MTVATLNQRRFGQAEKALLDADSHSALEIAWAAHGNAFPEGSREHRDLLTIYQDKHAQFAVELARYLRAG